ncbi:cytosine/adenosine deaminase-related metal-dependent hydrolase [Promicromonospora sp. AC04]|uniref:amidohydrolase family protein n=1 Tax=Promicromonospora sp. AC04 TaxID=2135723 RepID=UPI000D370419|nr:amidohydrolase family protein [Promicromonospora sp. AC04]PUB20795.1 cytosine/adenosine deaminase-related metal-dependent hydrolase [Promicromonospora sp. AC04]
MSPTEVDAQLDRILARETDPERRIVLRGAHIVTMDDRGTFVGDLLVRGGVIEDVVPGSIGHVDGGLVIDATDRIVIPGLIDSHVHAWEGQLRGIAPDVPFQSYMAIAHGGLAPHYTPQDIAIGQTVTAMQAINGGTTTIVDNSHNSRTSEHSDAAIDALLASGIRAVHAAGSPTVTSPSALPADVLRLRDSLAGRGHGRVTVRLFDVAPSLETWRFAAEHSLDVSSEVAMGMPGLEDALASDLLGPAHTLNHCAGLTTDMWRRIADAGAAVNLAPRSDPHYGLGASVPVMDAGAADVQVGISSDNELSYAHDMFTEMRVLLTVQRGLAFARAAAGDPGPVPYGVLDVLRAATVGGALNANLAHTIGTLTPGKKADFVVLTTNTVSTSPWGSVHGTVVNFSSAANVEAVFIDGRVKKWAGELVGFDLPDINTQAERSREQLLSAYGSQLAEVRAGLHS